MATSVTPGSRRLFSPASCRISLLIGFLTLLPLAVRPALASDKWTTPTPEELAMTSLPQVPGAPAVLLFREEISDDNLSMHSTYVRLKVLTEKGKEYADVELPYIEQTNITDIAGRTIQPDGTIVPFTGKPYTKTLFKGQGSNVQAKVFTLPSVNVGSIIEYRYAWRYADRVLYAPTWYLQTDLFLRKGHFVWHPYDTKGGAHYVIGADGKVASVIAWAQNLPEGAKVIAKTIGNQPTFYELDVHDIMPLIDEEHSPPMASISERVAFYYSGSTSSEEYWRDAGKSWSKHANSFIGPGNGVKAEVARITTASDTPEAKLKKIYAAVMELDNTDFTRQKDRKEIKYPKNTDDVLAQKSGSGDDMTMLFVAMARAAGLKADMAVVAPRSKRFFWPALLNFNQLEDSLAIVELNGKPHFFDPGERYCPFGLWSWSDSLAEGMQQSDNGAIRVVTPELPYTASQIKRIGDLSMAPDGTVNGVLTFSFTGLPALRWRQLFLTTDLDETQRQLKKNVEETLPKGSTITLLSLKGMEAYEDPLIATYRISGPLGTATGKRIIVPAQFFQVDATTRFSAPTRDIPVDLHYGSRVADAVRITLPPTMHWEAEPKGEAFALKQSAQYHSSYELKENALTFRRVIDLNDIFYKVENYPALHEFFGKVASSDNTQALITLPAGTSAPASDKPPADKGGNGE
jgi:Domain of Unknown Function with PDB structure (DUF3857)/Transglutaminase-like superfamily